MKFVIVAIYDKKAEVYGLPNYFTATGIGIRSFVDEVNRPAADNILYRHPEDFVLYHLGDFEDSKPTFTVHEFPKELARGSEVAVRDDSPNGPGVH